MIKREQFLAPIRPFYSTTDLVKVIIGIRRAGKSVLLTQIADEIRQSGVDDNHIILINFELFEYSEIKTARDLNEYIMSHINRDEKYYLLFDEIQNVTKFELVINSLRSMGNISTFITGSNAHLLSGNLATHLSGRYVQFTVTPFTFSETMEITGETNRKTAFDNYLKWGGLPGRFAFDGDIETAKYLGDVYDAIVLRDITQRSGLRDLNLLDNIIRFLLDNIGNIFSANTVSKYLKSQSRSVSPETLYNYIDHILGSLLFTKVDRYDIRGKNVFATLEKYYVADLGILNLKRASTDVNLGGRLENIVAEELIARGYRINVGVLRDAEIDFVAEKDNSRIYIQVAYTIDSDTTLEREINAFNNVRDNYDKLLLTTDTTDYSQNGIKHINVIEWLLNQAG
jgi:predicted AAA+ superfamily ATPase